MRSLRCSSGAVKVIILRWMLLTLLRKICGKLPAEQLVPVQALMGGLVMRSRHGHVGPGEDMQLLQLAALSSLA